MKRETAENLVEALELASVEYLMISESDRLRCDRLKSCISQVVIDMLADDGGDDA